MSGLLATLLVLPHALLFAACFRYAFPPAPEPLPTYRFPECGLRDHGFEAFAKWVKDEE